MIKPISRKDHQISTTRSDTKSDDLISTQSVREMLSDKNRDFNTSSCSSSHNNSVIELLDNKEVWQYGIECLHELFAQRTNRGAVRNALRKFTIDFYLKKVG